MSITVVKRNGAREPYDANKINLAIEHASQGVDENITWVTQIASELELTGSRVRDRIQESYRH